jgi:hypothetical protein
MTEVTGGEGGRKVEKEEGYEDKEEKKTVKRNEEEEKTMKKNEKWKRKEMKI